MPSPCARLVFWATTLSLLIAPEIASADLPTGSFEFDFGGTNSVWINGFDATGGQDGLCGSYGSATFDSVESCRFHLVVDGRGKLSGFADIVGRRGATPVFFHGPLEGAQRGNNRSGTTRVSFEVELERTIHTGGFGPNGFIGKSPSLAFDGMVDAAGAITGTWALKICPGGVRCTTTRFPGSPSTWNYGHWSLELEIEDFGSGTLDGVAQIHFGDDSSCDFMVDGLYNPKQDAATLELTPISTECTGTSLRLRKFTRFEGRLGPIYFGQLQYKLFGVNGVTAVSTEAPTLYRVPLAHHLDPINQPLPPLGLPGSGSSGLVETVEFVQWPLPQSGSAQSSSASIEAIFVASALEQVSVPPAAFRPAAAAASAAAAAGTNAPLDLSGMESSVLLQPYTLTLVQGSGPTFTILLQPGFDPLVQY